MDLLFSPLRKMKRLFCHDNKSEKFACLVNLAQQQQKGPARERKKHNSLSALNAKTLLILNSFFCDSAHNSSTF